jgi:hypothetical protein
VNNEPVFAAQELAASVAHILDLFIQTKFVKLEKLHDVLVSFRLAFGFDCLIDLKEFRLEAVLEQQSDCVKSRALDTFTLSDKVFR